MWVLPPEEPDWEELCQPYPKEQSQPALTWWPRGGSTPRRGPRRPRAQRHWRPREQPGGPPPPPLVAELVERIRQNPAMAAARSEEFEAAAAAVGLHPTEELVCAVPCWLRALIAAWGLDSLPDIVRGLALFGHDHTVPWALPLNTFLSVIHAIGQPVCVVLLQPAADELHVGLRPERFTLSRLYQRFGLRGTPRTIVAGFDMNTGDGHYWATEHPVHNGRPVGNFFSHQPLTEVGVQRLRQLRMLLVETRLVPSLPSPHQTFECVLCGGPSPRARGCIHPEGHGAHQFCLDLMSSERHPGAWACQFCYLRHDPHGYLAALPEVGPCYEPGRSFPALPPAGEAPPHDPFAPIDWGGPAEAIEDNDLGLEAQPQEGPQEQLHQEVEQPPPQAPIEREESEPAAPQWPPGQPIPAMEARARVIVVTGSYLPELAHYHQALYPGGTQQANAGFIPPTPHCTCGMSRWGMRMPCWHIMKCWAGGVVLVYGEQLHWLLKLRHLGVNVRVLVPRRARTAQRGGELHLVMGNDQSGWRPEPVSIFPMPSGYTITAPVPPQLGVVYEDLQPGWFTYHPRWSFMEALWEVADAVRSPSQWLSAITAVASGSLLSYVGQIWHLVEPYLVAAAAHIPGCAFLNHWGIVGAVAKVAMGLATLLHLPLGVAIAATLLGLFVIKSGIVNLAYRLMPSGVLPQICFALTGPLQMATVLWHLPHQLPSFEALQQGPLVQDYIDMGPGNAQQTAQIRNIVATRQATEPTLVRAIVNSVMSQAGYPNVLQQNVDTALATVQAPTALPPALPVRGAGDPRRPECRHCGGPLRKKRRNMHMCERCWKAAKNMPDTDEGRYATIQELHLTVTEPVPLLAIKARTVPPPAVVQRREWSTVKSSFDARIHAAAVRQQNERRRAVLVGVGHPGHWPGVFPRGPESLFNGLKSRTYREVPQAQAGAYNAMEYVRDAMFNHVPRGCVGPCPFDQWLACQERAQEMAAAKAEKDRNGWDMRQDKLCKPFIKAELHYAATVDPGGSPQPKREGKPRPIYCLSDKTQVVVGVWTYPLMKFFKEHLGRGQVIQYCGCNNPRENQAVLNEIVERWAAGHEIYLNDFTCFETTQNKRTMRVVRRLYRSVWNAWDDEREMCMDWWEAPRFSAHSGGHRLSGQLPEMMCSGRSDTAITNSLLNSIATATAHAAARLGITIQQLANLPPGRIREVLAEYRMYFVGDDSVVVCPPTRPGYLQRAQDNYLALGLNCKLEKVEHIRDVVFLANRPYNVATMDGRRQWVWGPTLGRRLYKHHYMLDGVGDPTTWLQTVAQMETICYSHVPLLGSLARRVCQLVGAPRKLNKVMELRLLQQQKYTLAVAAEGYICDELTFMELAPVYGVDHRRLQMVDSLLGSVPQVPYLFSDPVIDRIMAKDN